MKKLSVVQKLERAIEQCGEKEDEPFFEGMFVGLVYAKELLRNEG